MKSKNQKYIKKSDIFPIYPPYIKCLKCEEENVFGIPMIYDHRYIRECKKCSFKKTYNLPELDKKIIYIDQFVLSNMLKAEKSKLLKKDIDEFWQVLIKKLRHLTQLQIIVCPYSEFHIDESLITKKYHIDKFDEMLRTMYMTLSYNTMFPSKERIEHDQIYQDAKEWIKNRKAVIELDIHDLMMDDVNKWGNHYILYANTNYELFFDDIIKVRNLTHEGISQVAERWKKEKKKNFNDFFEEESTALGETMVQIYIKNINNLCPPSSVDIINQLKDLFLKNNIEEDKVFLKIKEYLNSSSFKELPFNKLSSILYASLARKFALGGRKKPPNIGMVTDVEIISLLLPYCDAMFIDNECYGYLKENPGCDMMSYESKIFSLNNKEDFLSYLDDVLENAPENIIEKACEIYNMEKELK